ncbi:hypothetical protein NKH77_20960 [Streptomyces sp. M19]
MTDHEAPLRWKLTGSVRVTADDKIAIRVALIKGLVHMATEELLLGVDDASVLQAQLTRVLNERAFPGMEQREREGAAALRL